MARDEWQAEAICAIIESCARSGVSKLRFRGLELDFSHAAPVHGVLGQQGNADLPLEGRPTEIPNTNVAQIDQKLLEDARLSQLLVSDPVAFEQQMIDEHMGA